MHCLRNLMRVAVVLGTVMASLSNAAVPTSPEHHGQVIKNYLAIWSGDLSLANTTLSPNLTLQADRFPSPTGSGSVPIVVNSAESFTAFVQRSRTGWDKYSFVVDKSVANGLHIAIRWRMEGVIGANFTLVPTTLKQGDKVTYYGNDFLVLNPCTGLIDEVDSTQDLMTFFHELGLTSVTV